MIKEHFYFFILCKIETHHIELNLDWPSTVKLMAQPLVNNETFSIKYSLSRDQRVSLLFLVVTIISSIFLKHLPF